MEVFTGGIGDHFFYFESSSNELISWLREALPQEKTDGFAQGMRVVLKSPFGEPFQDFEVRREVIGNQIHFERKDYSIKVDDEFTNAEVLVYDTFALKHALMNLYSAFIVHHGWGLLMHSSCVVQDGMAYLFTGQSGAGKSTTARLSAPRPVLSNEATIIKLKDDQALAYNSFFFRSDPGIFIEGIYPLEAIHLLRQSLEIRRERITSASALTQLLDKVFYWSFTTSETMKVLRLVRKLSVAVPTYDLYFQKNDEFWREIV